MNAPNNTQDAMAAFSPAPCYASLPPVLDACCGGRMMWFDREDTRALFVDRRCEVVERSVKATEKRFMPINVNPDVQADFTNLPFPDDSFSLVVFDPPHGFFGERSFMAREYGTLRQPDDWREMLRGGFRECFRVLKPNGTLIFKWNETDVPTSQVLALTDAKPLFGHKSGKQMKTHWIAFLKHNDQAHLPPGGGGGEAHEEQSNENTL